MNASHNSNSLSTVGHPRSIAEAKRVNDDAKYRQLPCRFVSYSPILLMWRAVSIWNFIELLFRLEPVHIVKDVITYMIPELSPLMLTSLKLLVAKTKRT